MRGARRGALTDGRVRTRDLGGTASTLEYADAIGVRLGLQSSKPSEPESPCYSPPRAPCWMTSPRPSSSARRCSDTSAAITASTATRRASASTPISTSCGRRSGTRFYRALQHPLYPILRKIERKPENLHHVLNATRAHRIVYASNHKSHTDYLVEPLVLDDNGIRPPLIAAGINLFGGPLGLLHRHVTGAIPIRRNTKDPAYLITLKAYVAEILKKHDLFFYPEGGRSYSGELKPAKTGLIHAALTAGRPIS